MQFPKLTFHLQPSSEYWDRKNSVYISLFLQTLVIWSKVLLFETSHISSPRVDLSFINVCFLLLLTDAHYSLLWKWVFSYSLKRKKYCYGEIQDVLTDLSWLFFNTSTSASQDNWLLATASTVRCDCHWDIQCFEASAPLIKNMIFVLQFVCLNLEERWSQHPWQISFLLGKAFSQTAGGNGSCVFWWMVSYGTRVVLSLHINSKLLRIVN